MKCLRRWLTPRAGRTGGRGTSAPGPINTAAPAVTGTLEVGEVLTCSTGAWTGTGVISYAYQWRRNGANIGGATANTHTVVSADEGAELTCRVTATDDLGSRGATSNAVSIPGAEFESFWGGVSATWNSTPATWGSA